eukprot:551473_1
MALKLNPTILKAGRLIGYGSIHSNLNCITLAVIKSINYEESSVQTVDIDEYNMDNCRVQSHSWNNLFIIAPVITIDLDDGTSELKQYALQGCVPTSSYDIQTLKACTSSVRDKTAYATVAVFIVDADECTTKVVFGAAEKLFGIVFNPDTRISPSEYGFISKAANTFIAQTKV